MSVSQSMTRSLLADGQYKNHKMKESYVGPDDIGLDRLKGGRPDEVDVNE